ncbi:hypothetical protein QBC32DRAFT_383799 [Pseudoneurospora amorphoporcata]|uniref:Uncharacterized protein n=1 Tax=Pseudoneurospora amorphoporcata TaxID=241081 RepID=A0AAN6NYR4_9PEZI|nr:hypothetical protein QBC32DRAFT_383799 [Pseudoneurospora amorphoporcata]
MEFQEALTGLMTSCSGLVPILVLEVPSNLSALVEDIPRVLRELERTLSGDHLQEIPRERREMVEVHHLLVVLAYGMLELSRLNTALHALGYFGDRESCSREDEKDENMSVLWSVKMTLAEFAEYVGYFRAILGSESHAERVWSKNKLERELQAVLRRPNQVSSRLRTIDLWMEDGQRYGNGGWNRAFTDVMLDPSLDPPIVPSRVAAIRSQFDPESGYRPRRNNNLNQPLARPSDPGLSSPRTRDTARLLLSDISGVEDITIPIYPDDLSNEANYRFSSAPRRSRPNYLDIADALGIREIARSSPWQPPR